MFWARLLQRGCGFGGDSQDISTLAHVGTINSRSHSTDHTTDLLQRELRYIKIIEQTQQ